MKHSASEKSKKKSEGCKERKKLPGSEHYLLRISAGPNENNLKVVSVNDEDHPIYINSANFTGYILVRVNNFNGVTPDLQNQLVKQRDPKKQSSDITEDFLSESSVTEIPNETTPPALPKDTDPGSISKDAIQNTFLNRDIPSIDIRNKPLTKSDQKDLKGYHNPRRKPKSKYFKGRNRKYSIVIQGRFKNSYHGDEIIFGVDSNAPLQPIPGSSIGLRVCKWLDPALEAELSGSDPHIYTPLVSAMNSMSIYHGQDYEADLTAGKQIGGGGMTSNDYDTVDDQGKHLPSIPSFDSMTLDVSTISNVKIDTEESPPADIREWAFSKSNVPENCQLLFLDSADATYACTYEKRKKLFASQEKREETTISPDYIYCMDFYGMHETLISILDAYYELTTFTLKLPGFSMNAFKYWDGEQPLRYRCITRDASEVFFVIQFDLIPKSEFGMTPTQGF